MKELLEELQKRVQPASPFKWEVLPNKLVVGQCSIEDISLSEEREVENQV